METWCATTLGIRSWHAWMSGSGCKGGRRGFHKELAVEMYVVMRESLLVTGGHTWQRRQCIVIRIECYQVLHCTDEVRQACEFVLVECKDP